MQLNEKYKDKEKKYNDKYLKINDVYKRKYEQTGNREIEETRQKLKIRFDGEHNNFVAGVYKTETGISNHFGDYDLMFSKYMQIFNTKYNGGANAFAATKEDAEKVLRETLAELLKIKEKLKSFNEEYRKTGRHMNNLRAIETINEITDKMAVLESRFNSIKNMPKTDFDRLIHEYNYINNYYLKLCNSIVSYRPYYL